MRSNNVANSAVRTYNGRLTFYDERLRFVNFPMSEGVDLDQYDASDDGLLRAGVFSIWAYSMTGTSLPFTGTFSLIETIMPGSRIAVHDTTIFLQAANGDVKRGSTVLFNIPEPVSIAPVSATQFYMFRKYDGYLKVFYVDGTTQTDCNCNIQFDWTGAPISDAVNFNGFNYVYFGDDSRAKYFKAIGAVISNIDFVVPLDVVDDTSLFRLSSAQVIDGKVFVTGVLKRTNGMSMHIYTIGPEEFTMGRDLVIRPERLTAFGKLHVSGNTVYYIGPSMRFISDATRLVGVDNPARKCETQAIVGVKVSSGIGQPSVLTAELPSSITHAAVRTGSRLVFEGAVNGSYFKVGEFAVDAVVRPREGTGKSLTVVARSWSMKALSQWESDASYDYWSQTKLSVNPKSMADFLRVSGKYADENDSLSITNLNVDGYLYASAKASRNGICKGKFRKMTGDFQGRVGVAVNYYRETKYEAAGRLGIDTEAVTENDYGHNGIFAVWGATEHTGGVPGVGTYHVWKNVWTKLASAPFSPAVDAWFWLMVVHHEGNIKTYFRLDTDTSWTMCNNTNYAGKELWWKDEQGRGALFLRATTPNALCYPFGSEDDYVPVVDNATFPSADIVLVDDEQIQYSSKSQNVVVDNLQYRYGNLLAQTADPGTKDIVFANARITSRIIQAVSLSAGTFYVTAIKLWMKKIGYPEDGLEVMINDWPPPKPGENDFFYKPLGTEMEKKLIPSEDISKDGGWVVARFPKTYIEDNWWLVLQREHEASHPSSQTYYASKLTAGNYGVDTWFFDEDEEYAAPTPPSWWYNTGGEDGNHLGWLPVTGNITTVWTAYNGNIPFKLYGTTQQPGEEFLIYVAHDTNLSHTANYYNGQAITVFEGSGVGNTFKIGRYEHGTETCLFAVDRNPSDLLDETSVLRVVPVLNVASAGRGYGTTTPAAHLGVLCSVYRAGPYVQCQQAEFFSGEVDRGLDDMLYALARKAGALNQSSRMLIDGSYTTTPEVQKRNFVIKFNFAADTVRVDGRNAMGYIRVDVMTGYVRYYAGAALREMLSHGSAIPSGSEITVSFFDKFISVWANGRLLASFTLSEADATLAGTGVIASCPTAKTFRLSEACTRVDNFIFDGGRKGAQLAGEMIGEKRFFLQDDENGNLRVFATRTEANTSAAPYILTTTDGHTDTDATLVTRLRLEGTNISEQYDAEMMVEHGNLFHQANMPEINSQADAEYYTAIMLDDIGSRMVAKVFNGSVEPKVEAGDTIYVQTPEGVVKVLVDGLDLNLDTETFDMTIDGRIPRSEL